MSGLYETMSVLDFLGNGVPYVSMGIKAIITLILGYVLSKWVSRLAIRAMARIDLDEALTRFLGVVIRYIIWFSILIAIADTLGFDTSSALAVLASAGLAIGLALQGSLSHIASGVMLLFNRPFTLGDAVEIGGKLGVVAHIGLFSTELTTADGLSVFLPNSTVTNGVITNFTRKENRRVTVAVGVEYGVDVERVRTVLTEAVTCDERILTDPAPAVAFTAMGDSTLQFEVRVWVKNADFGSVSEKLRTSVYNKLNDAKINIPFPQMDVHLFQEKA